MFIEWTSGSYSRFEEGVALLNKLSSCSHKECDLKSYTKPKYCMRGMATFQKREQCYYLRKLEVHHGNISTDLPLVAFCVKWTHNFHKKNRFAGRKMEERMFLVSVLLFVLTFLNQKVLLRCLWILLAL